MKISNYDESEDIVSEFTFPDFSTLNKKHDLHLTSK